MNDSAGANVAVVHFAGRAGDHNDRAMAASPRLAAALAARFDVETETIGEPRPALSTDWDVELEAARDELTQMQRAYLRLFDDGRAPVTALSRCAVAPATLPVVARYRPDAVVVWFDAHADLNTPETTTTGYLGGLALSAPLGLWDSGLGSGLRMERAIIAGGRDIDPPEASLIASTPLTLVEPGTGFAARLADAVAGRPVYIHIDCDVLEPGIVPTDYRIPGGLTLDEFQEAVEAVSGGELVGVEIGELETETGEEDLAPLLAALEPALGRLP
ncbi:arginase family protein [Gulosibacter sp. 10]|uniref:arginase family protein n=1 Tax=Gulosibacter sp. 10 TaxID=1255570 RepID=UPI000B36450E|nr:arginase family protein [Gulosibacter sp. 10]